MRKILIDAVYINESGGKVLLEYLIKNLLKSKDFSKYFFLFDNRFHSSIKDEIPFDQKKSVEGTESARLSFYKNRGNTFLVYFCFGNVPPPCQVGKSMVFIYFHNALILSTKGTSYKLLKRFNFWLKCQYIKLRSNKKYIWIVQTKGMAQLLRSKLNTLEKHIKVLPFFDAEVYRDQNTRNDINNRNFLYVANGNIQKNHIVLLEAWEYLFEKFNLKLTLHLTIGSEYQNLISYIDRLNKEGLNIVNHGICDTEKLKLIYSNCNYCIYPSLSESFGLPLVEASLAGCRIIASDLPYVYDVILPIQTFNPFDKFDIGNKIRSVYLEGSTSESKLIIKDNIEEILRLVSKDV